MVEKGLERALGEQKALHSHWQQTAEKTKIVHLELNLADILLLCALPTCPPLLHPAFRLLPFTVCPSLPPIHLASGSRRLFHLLPLWPPSSLHSPYANALSPLGAHLRLSVSLPTPSPISSSCSTCPPPAAILLLHCCPFTVPHFPPAFPPTSGSCFSLSDLSYSLYLLLQNPLILFLG